MLSQLFYWSKRVRSSDGWFYKTRQEWTEETCLSRSEQESARRRLVALGIMDEELRGTPAKLWFRLNRPTLAELADALTASGQEDSQQVGRNPANWMAGKLPTTNSTESTTDTLFPLPVGEWLISIQKDDTYAKLEVLVEHSKLTREYQAAKGREPTRKEFLRHLQKLLKPKRESTADPRVYRSLHNRLVVVHGWRGVPRQRQGWQSSQ
jgi:hypothetical protein